MYAYYIKSSNIFQTNIPSIATWMFKKIIGLRKKLDYDPMQWEAVITGQRFLIKKSYQRLKQIPPKIPWSSIIINNLASSKSMFVLWMVAHGRLSTLDRNARWGIIVDPICIMCKQQDESYHHLFLECQFMKQDRVLVMQQF